MLRDWARSLQGACADGRKDYRPWSNAIRLSKAQQAERAAIVETGTHRNVHGRVRWRRVDLQRFIAMRLATLIAVAKPTL
jgi:hypothetical protein